MGENEGKGKIPVTLLYLKGGWYVIIIIKFEWLTPNKLFLRARVGVYFTISDLAADVRVAAQPLVAFSNLPARKT